MNAIISLGDYLDKRKTFVIPKYQRGYIWGKKRTGKDTDSVTNLLNDLINSYNCRFTVFLQGFTVTECEREIIIIDGQQRTTFLYLLLKYLGYNKEFKIKYEIREVSNYFLDQLDTNDIINNIDENKDEQFQDIFFFKKTLRIIHNKLVTINKTDFLEYLLSNIKFLYININECQATKVFTMMNGSKAEMSPEEIIKAEILRLASLSDNFEDHQTEWEKNMLRSRYAREWDKWLHWWNKEDVQSLYCCNNNMGLLISSYLGLKNEDDLTFEAFKAKYLSRESSLEAKKTFDGLRRLQKRFEDAYYEVHEHNMIGAILRLLDSLNQKKFIQYYFVDDNRHQNYLQKYYKLVFLGLTHDEIIEHKREEFVNKYDLTYKSINHDFLYYEDKKAAFRLLLRLNIDQDILQNRFFNFKIWEGGERSLEHIQAKSKVGHYEDGLWLDGNNEQHENNSDFTMLRDDIQIKMPDNSIMKTTEHSIGNLVLLYKNENSSFNASDFSQKKELFFSPNRTELIRSRHLLHTICVFAEQQDWNGESIAFNKRKTIEKFEKDYNELKSEFKYEEQD